MLNITNFCMGQFASADCPADQHVRVTHAGIYIETCQVQSTPEELTGVAMKPPPAGTVLKKSADSVASVASPVTGTNRLFRPCKGCCVSRAWSRV